MFKLYHQTVLLSEVEKNIEERGDVVEEDNEGVERKRGRTKPENL